MSDEAPADEGVPAAPSGEGELSKTSVAGSDYLVTGNLSTDETVLDYMRTLQEHKKKCEQEGKYMEAKSTAERMYQLRVEEEAKRKKEMALRQDEEQAEAQSAYKVEMEQHTALWEEKMTEYEKSVLEQVERLKEAHEKGTAELREELAKKAPKHPKFSKDLLDQRVKMEMLARQGQYNEAQKYKKATDRLEVIEMQGTLAEYDAKIALAEQQLLQRQKREVDALLQRAQRGRDELVITRDQDIERRAQRFKNVMLELTNLHKLEEVQLRYFLEQQMLAGKREPPGVQRSRASVYDR